MSTVQIRGNLHLCINIQGISDADRWLFRRLSFLPISLDPSNWTIHGRIIPEDGYIVLLGEDTDAVVLITALLLYVSPLTATQGALAHAMTAGPVQTGYPGIIQGIIIGICH